MVVVVGGVVVVVGGGDDVVVVGGGWFVCGGGVCAGGGVVVVVVVGLRFEVVVVAVADDVVELVGVVVEVDESEVLLPSEVVPSSSTWTESWLVRSGWASSLFPPASMATVAKAVDTTKPATPSAR